MALRRCLSAWPWFGGASRCPGASNRQGRIHALCARARCECSSPTRWHASVIAWPRACKGLSDPCATRRGARRSGFPGYSYAQRESSSPTGAMMLLFVSCVRLAAALGWAKTPARTTLWRNCFTAKGPPHTTGARATTTLYIETTIVAHFATPLFFLEKLPRGRSRSTIPQIRCDFPTHFLTWQAVRGCCTSGSKPPQPLRFG